MAVNVFALDNKAIFMLWNFEGLAFRNSSPYSERLLVVKQEI